MSSITIASFSGFWGDSSISASQIIKNSPVNIDYLVGDYLAELTMSILTRKKLNKKPCFCEDFVKLYVESIYPCLKEKKMKTTVIVNAGGLDPIGAANALCNLLDSIRVGAIVGDNLYDITSQKTQKTTSRNAYLGSTPIADLITKSSEKFDVILTGRVVDSALVLGPFLADIVWPHFGRDIPGETIKDMSSYLNALSLGTLGGHLIECGAQCTGGLFTDCLDYVEKDVDFWSKIGYPIIKMDMTCIYLTKPLNSGGVLSRLNVTEQMFYEVSDITNYLCPDVSCDWSKVLISDEINNQIQITGAIGKPPPEFLKVCETEFTGEYKAILGFTIIGENAYKKCKITKDAMFTRFYREYAHLFKKEHCSFNRVHVEYFGGDNFYNVDNIVIRKKDWVNNSPPITSTSSSCFCRIAIAHHDKKPMSTFIAEMTSMGTSMAPGTCAFAGGGRATPIPIVGLVSSFINRFEYPLKIEGYVIDKNGQNSRLILRENSFFQKGVKNPLKIEINESIDIPLIDDYKYPTLPVPLKKVAVSRSGDKGDSVNIGIISRKPEYFPFILNYLKVDVLECIFKNFIDSSNRPKYNNFYLEKFIYKTVAPGTCGINFLLLNCLDGGGMRSLRTDNLGKAFGQILLNSVEIAEFPLCLYPFSTISIDIVDMGSPYFYIEIKLLEKTISPILCFELDLALERIEKYRDIQNIRCIVFSHNYEKFPKIFCAGAGLSHNNNIFEQNHGVSLYRVLYRIRHLETLTIANCRSGSVYGGGLGLVCSMDYILSDLSGKNDVFGILSEVKLGLVPSMISPFVIEKLGSQKFLHHSLSAIPIYGINDLTIKTTLSSFLKSHVSPCSPNAISTIKKLLRPDFHESEKELRKIISTISKSEEGQEGINSFLEKRRPKWHRL